MDAAHGRVFWIYRHSDEDVIACCGSNDRGVAIPAGCSYVGTLDGHLSPSMEKGAASLEDQSREQQRGLLDYRFAARLEGPHRRGVGGGEYGIRGYITAHDAQTGKEMWRFYGFRVRASPGTNVGSVPAESEDVLRSGGVEARRRI